MDRSLSTFLRSLQTSASFEDASRLLPTATSLLSQLTNPLNLTLLTSQILSSERLFPRLADLALCRRIFSVFYSAALHVVQDQEPEQAGLQRLSANTWTKAVIQGADEKSPRWRHVLLIGGILLGFEGHQQQNLSTNLRTKLESALVRACNMALEETQLSDSTNGFSVVFVLNHTFGLLSDINRSELRYDLFLPLAINAILFSREGLEHGYWLGLIDTDVRETTNKKFEWPARSDTFRKVQAIKSKVLMSSFGPLARLVSHAIDHVNASSLVVDTVDRLTEFARNLGMSWKRNKLSEVEVAEEADFLEPETIRTTLPLLWQTLREVLFATVVLLRAAIGRLLCDPILSTNANAPLIAMQSLHVLRHMNFIAARLGQTSSSQYVFVNCIAIDVLNQFPAHAESFLHAIRPTNVGAVSVHPLERSYDLFFLNTAEHFTLTLKSAVNEELLLTAAMPYISYRGDRHSVEVYEAAHSVLLAIFAAPQNSDIAARHLPFYLESLMESFPRDLSPRQLRLAVKSIIRIISPPSPLINATPLLPSIILDIIYTRALSASAALLPESNDDAGIASSAVPMSEQSALTLALIDSLPFLLPDTLGEWLPLTASLVNKAVDPKQKTACQQRFWEALSSGEMDVERAAICVAWWTSRGGRELLLYDDQFAAEEDDYMMTGALRSGNKL